MKTLRSNRGFTLVELVVVVAIMGILVGILVPQLGNAIKKSTEGTTKGNLATLRSGINIYYSGNEGQYPLDNLTSLVPTYITAIPKVYTPGNHGDSTAVVPEAAPTDTGSWSYNNVPGTVDFGMVRVGCTHTELNGKTWSTY
jgi:prepilin-type N-terminal cleavage/methylation domain-containing protein